MKTENVVGIPNLYISRSGQAFKLKNNKWVALPIYHSNSKSKKYKRAYIYINNRIYSLSRLVAKIYIPNPNNYPIVGHKDNNPLNNHVDNLYWCSQSENLIKASLENRLWDRTGVNNPYFGVIGENHSVSKYSNKLKIELYEYYRNNPNTTVSKLQSIFNIKSSRSVRKIIHHEDPVIVQYLKEVE